MTPEWERAVRTGAVEALQRLFDAGADVDGRDGHNQTGLMIAAHAGQPDAVAWLIGNGAALDHTAKYGLSALMLAAIHGHTEIVATLVAAGADLDLRGTGAPGFAGKTALDLATAHADPETARILRAGRRREP